MPIGTFLNNRTPTTLRGALFLSLSDQATVMARTATSDSGGGATYTWTAQTAVPCRVYPVTLRGQPRVLGGRIDERTTHFAVIPPNIKISPGQRLQIANRGTYEVTMELERTNELTSAYEVFRLN